jgi:membrane fusion protein (multidrug efflux system)
MSTEDSQPKPAASEPPSPPQAAPPPPQTAPPPPHAAPATPPAPPAAPPAPTKHAGSGLIRRNIIIIIAVIGLILAVPSILRAFHTVSTDDAYVNSYVTFVAPRVSGQVLTVLVDDNNRVKKGDVIVQLDPEPYQVEVAIMQAALDSARANLVEAQATVESQAGQLRSLRFQLDNTIENVDNQVALLSAKVATLDQAKAALTYAQQEFERAKNLLETKVISKEEYDQKREAIDAANAQVNADLEDVYQTRAALGLPHDPGPGKSLADVPPDIDQTFSAVREAVGKLMEGAAQLGVTMSSYNLTPKQIVAEFYRRDPGGDVDKIYAKILKNAPTVKQAETAVEVAQRNLDQANLNLRYCTIYAEIDGVVTRRNVNPGDYLQVGQSLFAIRSLTDIWVDCNFKETQLRKLRIGQHVDLDVDMYGSTHTFEGRISGFTEGTGSTLALLPAQNATGNFVKVVQRLPVRVDLVNYNPDQNPLFVGLSVTPRVDLTSTPTGPNAGRYLQETMEDTTAPATSNAQ